MIVESDGCDVLQVVNRIGTECGGYFGEVEQRFRGSGTQISGEVECSCVDAPLECKRFLPRCLRSVLSSLLLSKRVNRTGFPGELVS